MKSIVFQATFPETEVEKRKKLSFYTSLDNISTISTVIGTNNFQISADVCIHHFHKKAPPEFIDSY